MANPIRPALAELKKKCLRIAAENVFSDVCEQVPDEEALAEYRASHGRDPRKVPTKDKWRRPHLKECSLASSFVQRWGGSNLGFDEVGLCVMTEALTFVVKGPQGEYAVFWGDRLGYTVQTEKMTARQRKDWDADLAGKRLKRQSLALAAYGAQAR